MILAAALAAGCGAKPLVLARIGTRTITAEDFAAAARSSFSQYPGNPDEARPMLLQDLARRALLLELAEARGLFRDSTTANFRRSITQDALTQSLNQKIVPRDIPVSDAEVATFYAWTRVRAHLQLLFCPQREGAEAAAAALKAGAAFAEVERRYTPAGLIPNDGDLGEITAGALVEPLDGLVRSAPVGAVMGPLPAPGQGWFVARVLSRRDVPQQAPLETERPALSDMLSERKQRLVSMRAFESLRDQYRIAVEPGGPQALFRLLNPATLPNGSRAAPAGPTAENQKLPVASYVDAAGRPHSYTVGEAWGDLHVPDREKPNGTETPAIQAWIEQQVIRRIVPLEAARRGLDRDPLITRAIEERVNNAVLQSVYALAVESGVSTSDAEVHAIYAQHASQFKRLDAARVLHVTLPDSAAAATLIEHGAHAGSLRDAVKMAGVGAPVVEETVKFPSASPIWKPLQASFHAMPTGQWLGPLETPGGWRVIQLEDKAESAEAFDQLTPAVQKGLRDEALAQKREERLTALTDSLRAATHPYEIHEDALKRVPWPTMAGMP